MTNMDYRTYNPFYTLNTWLYYVYNGVRFETNDIRTRSTKPTILSSMIKPSTIDCVRQRTDRYGCPELS